MAELFFYFATMYAGKSSSAINRYDTAIRQHKKALAFTTEEDSRAKSLNADAIKSVITTRQNQAENQVYSINAYIIERVDFYKMIKHIKPDVVIVDEVQFIQNTEIFDKLALVADKLNVSVYCYGLKNDFLLRMFPASEYLFNIADKVIEIETSCSFCNRKAIANLRTVVRHDVPNEEKTYLPIFVGLQKEVEIKGNNRYFQVCRKCYNEIRNRIQRGDDVVINKDFKIVEVSEKVTNTKVITF